LVNAGTLKADSQVVKDFQQSKDYAAITFATSAVGAGNSTFANTCKTLPQQDALTFNAVYANAQNLNNFAPTSGELGQMVLDLKIAIEQKIIKNLVSPFKEISTGATGCP
jgi:hypothetical protein